MRPKGALGDDSQARQGGMMRRAIWLAREWWWWFLRDNNGERVGPLFALELALCGYRIRSAGEWRGGFK